MALYRKKTGLRLRRAVQALSLAVFVGLLLLAAFSLRNIIVPLDFFLRLDPLVATAVPLAVRQWIATLVPGILVIAVTFLAGRVFCGWICPMGATLDAIRSLFPGKLRNPSDADPRRNLKYALLIICLVAAFLGLNLVFWVSPIPLVTRFYALAAYPASLWAGYEGLAFLRPHAQEAGYAFLDYAVIPLRGYATAGAVAGFFALLFVLERVRPRFWCRYLCPAGAILAVCSFRPVWRRKVRRCIACGSCAKACPAGCLSREGAMLSHAECITCQKCVAVCPTLGTSFDAKASSATEPPLPEHAPPMRPSRRAFLTGAAGGAALAGLQVSGVYSALAAGQASVRPPGSFPETAFLARCVRCGECMQACPTNALQPAWMEAGFDGMFSPVLVPLRGVCEPECNACGAVCPTGAIHNLPLEEKYSAKIGTAEVLEETCIAWAEHRQCVVCEEVCPYGAIEVVRMPGSGVSGPVVDASRCFGCGYCERFCPVAKPAIIVRPDGALRQASPAFREAAAKEGLSILPASKQVGKEPQAPELPSGELPPGFTD